jgi:ribosomal protein S18 acetylase RimI-like enzyme
MKNLKIISKEKINEIDYVDIKKLEKHCADADNISFKLELEYKLNSLKLSDKIFDNINDFMMYEDDLLIGYVGINDFGGNALEVNGMVHPDYRNKGIFTRLYNLVIDEWKKRKQQEMLLLCDNKSELGLKFINKVCNTYDHSEYEMILDMENIPGIKQNIISLRNAVLTDCTTIAKMDSVFFNMEVKENDEFIVENIENKTTFIATENNIDIGKVRIELIDAVGGIYGLGIIPEFRGMGFGRELLLKAVLKLIELGAKKIMLQVEVNNKNALNLYKSCGFKENYVMEYYKLIK